MSGFLQVSVGVGLGVLSLAVLLTVLPRLGRHGRAISEALTRPPLLDLILATLTALPWIAGAIFAGWIGLGAAILGQMAALYAWIFLHELLYLHSARGPRIVRFTNRIVGRASNHLALWLTTFGVPVLWIIRLLEIFIYPTLIWLLRFPRYRHADWISLSRHKFRDLVGHDLVWCLYCDWMTGTWSLGTEMLRNVESFWCPIRFAHPAKLQNCRIDFPDIDGGWVPADGSMAQVQAVLEEKYGGDGDRSWFGHPARLAKPSGADHHSTALPLPPEMDEISRELLLEHSCQPHNSRPMPHATHHAQGELPLCNDRLTVFLRVVDDRIIDISFVGAACPICTASASMMTRTLRGRTHADAKRLFHSFHDLMTQPAGSQPTDGDLGDLAALAGVHRFPSRVKCATLPWHTMVAALNQNPDPLATESSTRFLE